MNLEEEVRCGYKIPVEMKKVWAVQLELLRELLRVCDKYGIQIFADGGTLLGTVRHGGYIPWDDDIDMIMFRKDYDRLVKISKKEFKSPFFFQTAYSDKHYMRAHAQLRMDNTTAILPDDVNERFHQGIFIDIFSWDDLPDDAELRSEKLQKVEVLRTISWAYKRPVVIGSFRKTVSRFSKKLISVFFSKVVFCRLESALRGKSDKESEWICNMGFRSDDAFVSAKSLKRSWASSVMYLPFEDIAMPVPSGYDHILTKLYGDYLVPRHTPTYHGCFWHLDAETDYKVFLHTKIKQ